MHPPEMLPVNVSAHTDVPTCHMADYTDPFERSADTAAGCCRDCERTQRILDRLIHHLATLQVMTAEQLLQVVGEDQPLDET